MRVEVLHAMVHPRPPASLQLLAAEDAGAGDRGDRPQEKARSRRACAQRLRAHGREHHRSFGRRGRVRSPARAPPARRRGAARRRSRRAFAARASWRSRRAGTSSLRRATCLPKRRHPPSRIARRRRRIAALCAARSPSRASASHLRDVLPAERLSKVVRVLLREPGRARESVAHGVARDQNPWRGVRFATTSRRRRRWRPTRLRCRTRRGGGDDRAFRRACSWPRDLQRLLRAALDEMHARARSGARRAAEKNARLVFLVLSVDASRTRTSGRRSATTDSDVSIADLPDVTRQLSSCGSSVDIPGRALARRRSGMSSCTRPRRTSRAANVRARARGSTTRKAPRRVAAPITRVYRASRGRSSIRS